RPAPQPRQVGHGGIARNAIAPPTGVGGGATNAELTADATSSASCSWSTWWWRPPADWSEAWPQAALKRRPEAAWRPVGWWRPPPGLGTRVQPAAKTTPKNLLNIFDRPILSYVVAEARAAGIEHFIFILGRGQGAIEDYFDHAVELESQLEAKGRMELLADIR